MVQMIDSSNDGRVRKATLAAAVATVAVLLIAGPAGASRTVKIKGGGWGHGIGMSQYGAYGRALNDKSATEILEKYYTSSNVKRRSMPARVRVGLLQGRTGIKVSSKPFAAGDGHIKFHVQGSAEKIAAGNESDSFTVKISSAGGLRIYKNGDKVKRGGTSVFGDPDHPLILEYEKFDSIVHIGSKYDYAYGKMKFGPYETSSCGSSYCQRLVLVLSMQKYIRGLGEVPASWPQAALRAQAIAGRTYAFEKIRRLGQHNYPCDCGVYDSTVDQAYIGDSKRTGSGSYWDDWKSAVGGTKDKVILYHGDPIQALYSSSSGGHTENNENVWGGTPLAYLRGVPDSPDDVAANPNHKWTIKMPWGVFSDMLDAAFNTGKVEKFKIIGPLGVSGRVTVVKGGGEGGTKIVGADRTVREDGWSVRNALDLKDTLFTFEVIQETAPEPAGAEESNAP